MTKRIHWNIELCRKWAEENTGCKVLSTEYVPERKGKMQFTCEDCGGVMECTWNIFYLLGQRRCRKCNPLTKRHTRSHEQFILDVHTRHKGVYLVLGQFVNTVTKIKTYCTICGNTWEPKAHSLLRGHGCPHCKQTKGELAIVETLTALQLPYKTQYRIPECRNERELPFDCAVLDSSDQSLLLLIEFDGEQHFDPDNYYAQKGGFDNIQKRDRIKTDYCSANNIPLLRIPYTEADNVEQLVTDKLYELNILQKATA